MIVVKVELHGYHSKKITLLGQMIIGNEGGTDKRGDYSVKVGRKGSTLRQVYDKPLRLGTVTNYPRLSYNVWRLVMRALKEAFPEEK